MRSGFLILAFGDRLNDEAGLFLELIAVGDTLRCVDPSGEAPRNQRIMCFRLLRGTSTADKLQRARAQIAIVGAQCMAAAAKGPSAIVSWQLKVLRDREIGCAERSPGTTMKTADKTAAAAFCFVSSR